MDQKRLLVLAGLLLAMVPAVALLWLVLDRQSIRRKYAQIRAGMTLSQVESVLGEPAQNTVTRGVASISVMEDPPAYKAARLGPRMGPVEQRQKAAAFKLWQRMHDGNPEWVIGVWFDTDGKVVDKWGIVVLQPEWAPSFLERLAARFGW
jgi:hypothetical protein